MVTSGVLKCASEACLFYIISCGTAVFSWYWSHTVCCFFEKTFLSIKGPKLCLSWQKALRGVFSNWFILGYFSHHSQFPQVFISGTKSECKRLLQTILQNRRLCTLLSPYFTPVASPNEFVTLYENVVAFLSEDNSDVVFMLLTKVKHMWILCLVCGLLLWVFFP